MIEMTEFTVISIFVLVSSDVPSFPDILPEKKKIKLKKIKNKRTKESEIDT
jgi:hypothetical protein